MRNLSSNANFVRGARDRSRVDPKRPLNYRFGEDRGARGRLYGGGDLEAEKMPVEVQLFAVKLARDGLLEQLVLLRERSANPDVRIVLEALIGHDGLTLPELTVEAGVTLAEARNHLEDLTTLGMVAVNGIGSYMSYSLAKPLDELRQ